MNRWLVDGLNDISKPSWLPSYAIAMNIPQGGVVPPCFSVTHLPVSRRARWQGGHVGDGVLGRRAAALMDVGVWVSRQNAAYIAQVGAMVALLEALVTSTPVVPVFDYWSNPAVPVLTGHKIVIGDMDITETAQDPNPDIYRRRALIRYDWTVRSNL